VLPVFQNMLLDLNFGILKVSLGMK